MKSASTSSLRSGRKPSRRAFMAMSAAALATPGILRHTRAYAEQPVVKVGFVSPRTGIFERFGEADRFVVESAKSVFDKGIDNNGKSVRVELIAPDSESVKARDVGARLIYEEKVDIITAASTTDTVNPVAEIAEVEGIPCITTDSPWEPCFFGRGGDPAFGFDWTYHFFWGLGELIPAYVAAWDRPGVEKIVGGLFSAGTEGGVLTDPEKGIPGAVKAAGFSYVDPGAFERDRTAAAGVSDFTPQIEAMKAGGCEIVTGHMLPPAFRLFWQQAFERSFRPKIVTFGAALLFPQDVEAIGDRADGLSTEVWWSPTFPFASSLTGQSAMAFAGDYTDATGRPWTQSMGLKHALFEVVADVVRRTADIDDSAAIRDAIASTNLETIAGAIAWTGSPVKNVATTPITTGQWRNGPDGFDLVVVDNSLASEIPVGGPLRLLA